MTTAVSGFNYAVRDCLSINPGDPLIISEPYIPVNVWPFVKHVKEIRELIELNPLKPA